MQINCIPFLVALFLTIGAAKEVPPSQVFDFSFVQKAAR
jgi:hypothetical protein